MRIRHMLLATGLLGFVSTASLADTVDNPGVVTFTAGAGSSATVGSRTASFGGTMSPPTLKAGVASDGTLTIAQADVTFPPADLGFGGYQAQFIVSGDIVGSIDPCGGAASIPIAATIHLTGPLLPSHCEIPITVNLSTDNDGGIAYDTSTGLFSVTDTTFAVPSSDCGFFSGFIDGQLGLPSPSGNNSIILNLSTAPVLQCS